MLSLGCDEAFFSLCRPMTLSFGSCYFADIIDGNDVSTDERS